MPRNAIADIDRRRSRRPEGTGIDSTGVQVEPLPDFSAK